MYIEPCSALFSLGLIIFITYINPKVKYRQIIVRTSPLLVTPLLLRAPPGYAPTSPSTSWLRPYFSEPAGYAPTSPSPSDSDNHSEPT